MTQLIINGTEYPWVDWDNYSARPVEMSESKRSITGKLFTQVRGEFYTIDYHCDTFGDELWQECLAVMWGGGDLQVEFLTATSDDLRPGTFRCTQKPDPSVAFDHRGRAVWHDITFRLEEIEGGS